MDETNLLKRLSSLELNVQTLMKEKNKIQEKQKFITQPYFTRLYKSIITNLPTDNIYPCRLYINEKYADDLKHKVLYPNYNTGFWYLIGEPELLPIVFVPMENDICVNALMYDDFQELD